MYRENHIYQNTLQCGQADSEDIGGSLNHSCTAYGTYDIYEGTVAQESDYTQSEVHYQAQYPLQHNEAGWQEVVACPEQQYPHKIHHSHYTCPVEHLDPSSVSGGTRMNLQYPTGYHNSECQQTSNTATSMTPTTAFDIAKSTYTTLYTPTWSDVTCQNSIDSCAVYPQSEYDEEFAVTARLYEADPNHYSLSLPYPQPVHSGFDERQMMLHPNSLRDVAGSETSYENATAVMRRSWSIYDDFLPVVDFYDTFDEWPDGDLKRVYAANSMRVMRHKCGWAMDDCNNHNPMVLKKYCIGILKCSANCNPVGGPVNYKPAILKSSRQKQIDRPCSTAGCQGTLQLYACGGNAGYPVSHYWRLCDGSMYFEARGRHDHARPNAKLPNARRRIRRMERTLSEPSDDEVEPARKRRCSYYS